MTILSYMEITVKIIFTLWIFVAAYKAATSIKDCTWVDVTMNIICAIVVTNYMWS